MPEAAIAPSSREPVAMGPSRGGANRCSVFDTDDCMEDEILTCVACRQPFTWTVEAQRTAQLCGWWPRDARKPPRRCADATTFRSVSTGRAADEAER